MIVLSAELKFHIPDSQSLKDKRQVSRSLIDGARHKFNASIAEVADQELHQILAIGIAVVSSSHSHAEEMLESIIRYMESSTDAQLVSIERLE